MSSFVILVRNHGKWLVQSRGTARLSVASLRTLESNFLQGENPNDDVAKRVRSASDEIVARCTLLLLSLSSLRRLPCLNQLKRVASNLQQRICFRTYSVVNPLYIPLNGLGRSCQCLTSSLEDLFCMLSLRTTYRISVGRFSRKKLVET